MATVAKTIKNIAALALAALVLCWITDADADNSTAVTRPAGTILPTDAQVRSDPLIFAYFLGNGVDGLHLASSEDGYAWHTLGGGKSFLKPEAADAKLMRDPSLIRGPDGVFRMVWTDSWTSSTIGYASSTDLLHWSAQKEIPVFPGENDVLNCWAPVIVYDEAEKQYLIFWASTIKGKFAETAGTAEGQYNHRIYSTTTTDFEHFTPAKLFFDPGFCVIDATMLRDSGKFYLIFKDETLKPVHKYLQMASSDSVSGPFTNITPAFTKSWVEGPAAIRVKDQVFLYFDVYREHHYGMMRSTDLKTWEDVTAKLQFPKGARHGTILQTPRAIVESLETGLK